MSQNQRLNAVLDALDSAVIAMLGDTVKIPPGMVKKALLLILSELGVDTAGIRTQSETIEIHLQRGKKTTKKEESS